MQVLLEDMKRTLGARSVRLPGGAEIPLKRQAEDEEMDTVDIKRLRIEDLGLGVGRRENVFVEGRRAVREGRGPGVERMQLAKG